MHVFPPIDVALPPTLGVATMTFALSQRLIIILVTVSLQQQLIIISTLKYKDENYYYYDGIFVENINI